eukprot:15178017-Alexandrium_andersonii.AAC.1
MVAAALPAAGPCFAAGSALSVRSAVATRPGSLLRRLAGRASRSRSPALRTSLAARRLTSPSTS